MGLEQAAYFCRWDPPGPRNGFADVEAKVGLQVPGCFVEGVKEEGGSGWRGHDVAVVHVEELQSLCGGLIVVDVHALGGPGCGLVLGSVYD